MANIPISALPSVLPSGYTNNDLLVIVNYNDSPFTGVTKNTPLSGLTSYVLSGVTFPTNYLPLSGGTVTGDTIFNQGLTATTISASTYLGLPLDVYVTGGTSMGSTTTSSDATIELTYRDGVNPGLYSLNYKDTFSTGGTFDNTTSYITVDKNDGTNYIIDMGGPTGLPEVDDRTIEVDTNYNWVQLRDVVLEPISGGPRTFMGQIIISGDSLLVTSGMSITGLSEYSEIVSGTIPKELVNVEFLTGYTKVGNQWLIPTGDTVTVNSNYQYFIYGDIIVQGTLILEVDSQLVVINGDVINSGGTITNNGTISNIEIPLFDTKVTGGTYSAGTITFTNNSGGTFTVTGLTTPFTGNTSATCITDLYVTNLNSCSPLHIQPTNSGDVYIGENGGVNVGIGTSTPTEKLFISGNTYITGGSSSFLVGNTQPYLARNLTNDFIQLNYDGFGQSLFASPTGIALSVGSVVGNGLRVNNTNNLVGNLLSYNFADYLFKSYYSGSTNYFEINHIGFNGDNKFGVNTIPTATIHSKGVDSSSSNFGLKVQDSGGTDNLVVRNDGNVGIGTNSPNANLDIYYGNTFTSPKNLFLVKQFFSNREVFKITDIGSSGGSQINSEWATWGFGMSADTAGNRQSIKGVTSTSGTASIIIKNSSDVYTFIVRDDVRVGIGTVSPSETLDVSGKTKTINFQMTSGATTTGYVLTDSDGNGNAQWQPASGITGVGNVFKYTTTTAFTASVTQTITHNLNTKFVHCSVWDSLTNQLVTAQVVRNSGDINNAVDITISTSGTYDILITG